MAKASRTSVSAEVFGKYNKKEIFNPTVIKKDQNIKDKILNRLKQSFMFMALDENDMNVVIDAMDEKTTAVGEIVIKQNEKG